METDVPAGSQQGDVSPGLSMMGALFRKHGVVYPIHPVGHMNLPRPKLPFKETDDEGRGGGVTFVVQVLTVPA